jgi:hypothetical protein
LAAGALNDLVGILPGQLHEEAVSLDGRLQSGDLLGGHIADHVATFLPRLMVVVGPSDQAADLAAFHPLNAAHPFQQGMNVPSCWVHAEKI